MKAENVIAIAIRLFIFYFVLWVGYQTLMLAVNWIVAGKIQEGAGAYALGIAVVLAVLAALWFGAAKVSAKLAPADTGDISFGNLTAADLMTFGFAMVGVWMSIDSLLQSVQLGLQTMVASVEHVIYALGLYGFKFLLGLGLAISARKLALRLSAV